MSSSGALAMLAAGRLIVSSRGDISISERGGVTFGVGGSRTLLSRSIVLLRQADCAPGLLIIN